jgi:hypothetical protein
MKTLVYCSFAAFACALVLSLMGPAKAVSKVTTVRIFSWADDTIYIHHHLGPDSVDCCEDLTEVLVLEPHGVVKLVLHDGEVLSYRCSRNGDSPCDSRTATEIKWLVGGSVRDVEEKYR